MIRFAEAFPERRIVSALLRQLSWSHFLSIIYLTRLRLEQRATEDMADQRTGKRKKKVGGK